MDDIQGPKTTIPDQRLSDSQVPVTPGLTQPQKKPGFDVRRVLFCSVILVAIVLVISTIIVLSIDKYRHDHQVKTISSSKVTAPVQASISSTGFSPNTIYIKVGQDVVWTNYDSKGHTVTSVANPKDGILAGFKSSVIAENQTYSFVFDKSGTYTYRDQLNPSDFNATVIVK